MILHALNQTWHPWLSKWIEVWSRCNAFWFSLALVGLLLSSIETRAQKSPWSSVSSLAWSDFQGIAPPLSPIPVENFDAFVYIEILWDFTWDPDSRNLELSAQAVFVHPESWYRPAAVTPTMLTHESGHFDYAEIHVRQFKQRIAESVELKELLRRCDVTEAEIAALLTEYHAEEIDELGAAFYQYDSETNHSQNPAMQNGFTNIIIPDLLSDLNAYTDPEISVTVENEGVVPTPGDYEGTLNYTLQVGPDSAPFGEWNWTLQGQWSFSFSADETSGISSWSHQYINNVVGGLLLTATTPSVQALPNIPLAVQDDASGSHYWMDFSAASTATIPSHELTFAPVSNLPIALPFTPGNTTISFVNGAAIALGNFMKEQGTPALNMRAPITCPGESLHYIVEVGAGQFFAVEWTLTRIADPLNAVPASGSGGGGMGGMTLPISDIESDVDAGTVTISWASEESDVSYTVEASEDLMTWSEIGSVTSTSTGITSFVDEDAHSERSRRFYRVQLETP